MKNKEILLFAGAVVGIALAAVGSIDNEKPGIPQEAIAVVEGAAIMDAEYQNALNVLEAIRKAKLSENDKQQVLDRLVNDQLMVGRAFELGLPENDAAVRRAIIDALEEFIISDKEGVQTSETELMSFYQDNINRYTPPPKYQVKTLLVKGTDKLAAINTAISEGKGVDVLLALGAENWTAGPNSNALSAGILRRFIGRQAISKLTKMKEGEISGPFEMSDDNIYVQLEKIVQSQPREFESVKALVQADYVRMEGEKTLADYIAKLRSEADIQIREAL